MTKLAFLFAGAVAAHAQLISLGVKGGSPINDPAPLSSSFSNLTQGRWTGGPSVELHLPWRFSVEFDALYRRYRTTNTYPLVLNQPTASFFGTQTSKAKAWDFPLMLKYRILGGPVRPFISAGYAWSHEDSETVGSFTCISPAAACASPDANLIRGAFASSDIWRQGPTAAAGVEFKVKAFAIAPEVRYTHLTQPNTNQVTGLVGISFGLPWRR